MIGTPGSNRADSNRGSWLVESRSQTLLPSTHAGMFQIKCRLKIQTIFLQHMLFCGPGRIRTCDQAIMSRLRSPLRHGPGKFHHEGHEVTKTSLCSYVSFVVLRKSGRWDSNPRYLAWRASVLPLNYARAEMQFYREERSRSTRHFTIFATYKRSSSTACW